MAVDVQSRYFAEPEDVIMPDDGAFMPSLSVFPQYGAPNNAFLATPSATAQAPAPIDYFPPAPPEVVPPPRVSPPMPLPPVAETPMYSTPTPQPVQPMPYYEQPAATTPPMDFDLSQLQNLGIPDLIGGTYSGPSQAFTAPLSNKGNPTSKIGNNQFYMTPDTGIRLVNNVTGEVVYSGTGYDAANEAIKAAQALTAAGGNKAGWDIQTTLPGSQSYYSTVANEKVNKSPLGTILSIAAPIAGTLLAGPLGLGALGLGATGTGALGAALGSAALGTARGESIGDILKSAALSGAGAYAGGSLGKAIGAGGSGAGAAGTTAGTSAGQTAGDVLGDIIVTGLSKAPQVVGSSIGGGLTGAVNAATTPPQNVQPRFSDEIVVTGLSKTPTIAGSVVGGSTGSLLDLGNGSSVDVNTGDIVVTGSKPGVPASQVIGSAAGAGAGGAGDIVVTAKPKPPVSTTDMALGAGAVPTLDELLKFDPNAGTDTTVKDDKGGFGPTAGKVLAGLAVADAVSNAVSGGSGSNKVSPGGQQLQSIFSASLPTPGEGGFKVGGLDATPPAARSMPDWYRYAMGQALDIPADVNLARATSPYAGFGPGTLGQETFNRITAGAGPEVYGREPGFTGVTSNQTIGDTQVVDGTTWVWNGSKRGWEMQYTDPATGQKKTLPGNGATNVSSFANNPTVAANAPYFAQNTANPGWADTYRGWQKAMIDAGVPEAERFAAEREFMQALEQRPFTNPTDLVDFARGLYTRSTQPKKAAHGGMMGYSHGGSNHSYAVGGPGTGRSDEIPAMLSDGEYVIDAETVALLGDGSSKAGAKRLDELRVNIRKHKGRNLAKGKFSVNAKRPEKYLSGGRA